MKRRMLIVLFIATILLPTPRSLFAESKKTSLARTAQPLSVLYQNDPTAIKNQYIVLLDKKQAQRGASIEQEVTASGGQIIYSYDAEFAGFAAVLPAAVLESLRVNPSVVLIEADRLITLNDPTSTDPKRSKVMTKPADPATIDVPPFDAKSSLTNNALIQAGNSQDVVPQKTQTPKKDAQTSTIEPATTQPSAPWGLDRIDQRVGLNGTFNYTYTGSGVRAYILDTGIRKTHQQFGGRVQNGYTSINDGYGTNDCQGHGTHVSGTVGGSTYGVAKSVLLYPVRVLGCNGSGSTSGVIAGVNWVRTNHIKPAVANMSLGGGYDAALNQSVVSAIQAGVTFVVASGNDYSTNACAYSPASAYEAITVTATDSSDRITLYSNTGTCTDISAPGDGIISSDYSDDTATSYKSGTSMATPHVVGVVAQYLQRFPAATPGVVQNALISSATVGRLSQLYGSPNLLLSTPVQNDCLVPELRYYSNRHFYTTAWTELSNGRFGWNFEGVVGYLGNSASCLSGGIPYYRYYNRYSGGHFYTTVYSELGAGTSVWMYEGIVGYLLPAPTPLYTTVPLYRYYNRSTGIHFYTTSFSELGNGNATYLYEGIPGYILSAAYR